MRFRIPSLLTCPALGRSLDLLLAYVTQFVQSQEPIILIRNHDYSHWVGREKLFERERAAIGTSKSQNTAIPRCQKPEPWNLTMR